MSNTPYRIGLIIIAVVVLSIVYVSGASMIQKDIEATKEQKEADRIANCLWQKDGRDYTGYAWNILKDQPTEQIVKTTGATEAQIEDCLEVAR